MLARVLGHVPARVLAGRLARPCRLHPALDPATQTAHLARGLYLVAELREDAARVVVALTMRDVAAARGVDLAKGTATPIGLGCRHCTRPDCPQRSAPPASRPLVFNERERGVSAFTFGGD